MDDWKNSRSIRLSQAGVLLFALLLAALDVGCFWILRWYINLRGMHWQSGFGMMAVIYLASVFGWVFLWKMWRLLGNLPAAPAPRRCSCWAACSISPSSLSPPRWASWRSSCRSCGVFSARPRRCRPSWI